MISRCFLPIQNFHLGIFLFWQVRPSRSIPPKIARDLVNVWAKWWGNDGEMGMDDWMTVKLLSIFDHVCFWLTIIKSVIVLMMMMMLLLLMMMLLMMMMYRDFNQQQCGDSTTSCFQVTMDLEILSTRSDPLETPCLSHDKFRKTLVSLDIQLLSINITSYLYQAWCGATWNIPKYSFQGGPSFGIVCIA